MKNKDVFVGICLPKNGNHWFIYGIFKTEDDAVEHFNANGDKVNDNYVVRTEQFIMDWK